MTLYRKAGGAPQPLPSRDYDAEGLSWTDLAANAEGRAATGWVEAPGYPEHDPATHRPVWDAGAEDWTLEEIEPAPEPIRRIAKVDFWRRFTNAERVGLMATRKAIDALTPAQLAEPQNAGLAGLALVFETFEMIPEAIELDHPETLQAVEAFEAAGIIAEGRAAELVA